MLEYAYNIHTLYRDVRRLATTAVDTAYTGYHIACLYRYAFQRLPISWPFFFLDLPASISVRKEHAMH